MDKINEIKNYLQENSVDAAFITTPDNVFYVSGFRSEPHERLLGVMIFKEAEPFVICPLMEVPDLKASGWTSEAVGHQDTEDAWEVLASAAVKRNIPLKNIAIEKSHLTVERLERMEHLFEGAAFNRLDEQLNKMRNIKSEDIRLIYLPANSDVRADILWHSVTVWLNGAGTSEH